MGSRFRTGSLLLSTIGLSLVFATAYLLTTSPDKVQKKSLRIAINPWPGYECLHLAQKLGYYEDEGLAVTLVEISSLSDVRRAFEKGRVDAMTSTVIETAIASAYSKDELKIVLMPDFSEGGDLILASGGIRSVTGLRGKRIGVEANSVCGLLVDRALEMHSVPRDDVEISLIEASGALPLLKKGRIDAVATYPPFSVEITESHPCRRIFDSSEIPGEIADVITTRATFLKENKVEIEKLVRAWDRAVKYLRSHPDEAIAIMAKRQGIPEEDFRKSLDGIRILTSTEQHRFFRDGTLEQSLKHAQNRVREAEKILGDFQDSSSFLYHDAIDPSQGLTTQ